MNNKSVLNQSKSVGCYCCCKIFESKEVKSYTDNGNTGLCPYCSADCLIGDTCQEINESIIKKAKSYWIGD